jgi:lipoate-protein ligase A
LKSELGNPQSWRLLRSGARPAAENMALDEVLLEAAPQLGLPVLRLYQWTEAAATFGYFQRFAEVERMTRLRPLVRRPTGGGLVPHEADWTYSLIFPPAHSWHRLKAVESYRQLHQWIQEAFGKAGFGTELSPGTPKESAGQCFTGAERFDLVWHDRKIAGAAQRRTRQGLLIQGSIQPPPGLGRAAWEKALCDIARAQWNLEWQALELEPAMEQRVQNLAKQKYATREYNQRR